jgi:hypothetical protein
MRRWTGNSAPEWHFDAIGDVPCPNGRAGVAGFKDELTCSGPDRDPFPASLARRHGPGRHAAQKKSGNLFR